MTAPPHSVLNSVRLLWIREGTVHFWIGSLLSNLGTWMQQVVEPWLILSLSGSSLLLGIDAFAMDAPVWILPNRVRSVASSVTTVYAASASMIR
jgi:hypothetical protein